MCFKTSRCLIVAAAVAGLVPHSTVAQNRIRLPSQLQVQPGAPPAPTVAPWSLPATPPPASPSVSLGTQIQPFDPYAIGVPSPPSYIPAQPIFPSAPSGLLPPAGTPATTYPGPTVLPPSVSPGTLPPISTVPGAAVPPASTVPSLPPPPLNPSGAQVVPAPTAVFPEGLPWTGTATVGRAERFFQDTGGIYTWLAGGNNPDDLGINEIEVFTSAVFKNFAHSAYGLRVTPGFIFDFTDGPDVPGSISLPSKLYSAYLDTLWLPQLTPQFGGELNFRAGAYSDFEKVSSDSVRYTGRALGVLQVTPKAAFKLGIEYLDRYRIKLLPAGGVLWTPNTQTRFDIYFPRPKLAQYLTTRGNTEIWWYIGGEYGGGAWTISREVPPQMSLDGNRERIDINDIRLFVGLEWDRLGLANGLFEAGWVTDREIYVADHRDEGLRPSDTVMLRAGLSF